MVVELTTAPAMHRTGIMLRAHFAATHGWHAMSLRYAVTAPTTHPSLRSFKIAPLRPDTFGDHHHRLR
jgi:hypothetical protein